MQMLNGIPVALLLSFTALAADQAGTDPAAIVRNMAEKLERNAGERQQYIYDKRTSTHIRTALPKTSRSVTQYEERRYTVTGAYGEAPVAGSRTGECQNNERVEPYTQPGFVCKGLEKFAGADGLFAKMLDEVKSRDGIPYWLLPLRPAYLRFFQFALKGKGELNGRPVYIIDFRPTRTPSPKLSSDDPYYGAHAWSGTAWIDEAETQPARIDGVGTNSPGGAFSHTFFEIIYQRVSKDTWFRAFYCNVLGGDPGDKAWAHVIVENSDFRRMDVFSQIAYISSTIRYH